VVVDLAATMEVDRATVAGREEGVRRARGVVAVRVAVALVGSTEEGVEEAEMVDGTVEVVPHSSIEREASHHS